MNKVFLTLILAILSATSKAQLNIEGSMGGGYFQSKDKDSALNLISNWRSYNYNTKVAIGITKEFYIGTGYMAWTLMETIPNYDVKFNYQDITFNAYYKLFLNKNWMMNFGAGGIITNYAVDDYFVPLKTRKRRFGAGFDYSVSKRLYKQAYLMYHFNVLAVKHPTRNDFTDPIVGHSLNLQVSFNNYEP
jgi:hypothetical protein